MEGDWSDDVRVGGINSWGKRGDRLAGANWTPDGTSRGDVNGFKRSGKEEKKKGQWLSDSPTACASNCNAIGVERNRIVADKVTGWPGDKRRYKTEEWNQKSWQKKAILLTGAKNLKGKGR